MKIVGTAIITDDLGHILIGKRPEGKDLAGLWEFPGGKQEFGETVEQCIIREIKEELDVTCDVGDFLLSVSREYAHGTFKLMVYQAKLRDLDNLKAVVHQELKWVSVDDLKEFQFPPADEEIIAYLQENF